MPRRDLTKSLEAVQRLFNVEPEPEPAPSQLEPRGGSPERTEPRHPVRLFVGRTTAHSHQVLRELSDEILELRRDLRRKDELITGHRAYIDLLERTIGDKDLLPGTTWCLETESTNELQRQPDVSGVRAAGPAMRRKPFEVRRLILVERQLCHDYANVTE
ncbi:hypothetical protein LTS18_004058 [Coniosporium uncinatum]|uniref:Uncharacterized protein n=1 Tax=Coniosporium uncinatum TaxID=93489 RepID=A0ACC3D600_9PEZI|nr:hypothetical protein LTS18_004058 [Coniosporium uncinatum]